MYISLWTIFQSIQRAQPVKSAAKITTRPQQLYEVTTFEHQQFNKFLHISSNKIFSFPSAPLTFWKIWRFLNSIWRNNSQDEILSYKMKFYPIRWNSIRWRWNSIRKDEILSDVITAKMKFYLTKMKFYPKRWNSIRNSEMHIIIIIIIIIIIRWHVTRSN